MPASGIPLRPLCGPEGPGSVPVPAAASVAVILVQIVWAAASGQKRNSLCRSAPCARPPCPTRRPQGGLLQGWLLWVTSRHHNSRNLTGWNARRSSRSFCLQADYCSRPEADGQPLQIFVRTLVFCRDQNGRSCFPAPAPLRHIDGDLNSVLFNEFGRFVTLTCLGEIYRNVHAAVMLLLFLAILRLTLKAARYKAFFKVV